MMIIIGLAMIFGLVFGGYTLAGGHFDVILKALPFEMMMVGGASMGALVAANSGQVLKMTAGAALRAFTGPKWKKTDYSDLLSLMFQLAQLYRSKGAVGIEPHIENPESSEIFKQFPRITKDHEVLDLIVDTFRMVTMQFEDPLHTDEVINKKIEAHHNYMAQPIKALNAMADALPAIGIVAAVLGVVKTMSSVDKPPAVLGAMIAGALVGTFLGVFLAYCIVQPLALRVKQMETRDAAFENVIRDVIVSILHGYAPALCIEIGRGNIPPNFRPTFEETEEQQKALKA